MASFFLFLLVLVDPTASICMPPTSATAASRQPHVTHTFLGRVLRVRDDSFHNVVGTDEGRLEYYAPVRAVEFLVQEGWRGPLGDTLIVVTYPQDASLTTGRHPLAFQLGHEYLVFAEQPTAFVKDTVRFEARGDGLVRAPWTTDCLGTRAAKSADPWILELRGTKRQ
jgi:hypothetical protein